MTDESEYRDGGCRCGAVRFRVKGRPMITMACHCTGCQKMTASAFSLSSFYALDNFEVTKGETVLGGLRQELKHHVCPDCKSWMFRDMMATRQCRSTLIDDSRGYKPFIETYTSEMLPWAKTPAMHFESLRRWSVSRNCCGRRPIFEPELVWNSKPKSGNRRGWRLAFRHAAGRPRVSDQGGKRLGWTRLAW